jgi:hypothetical protein
MKDPRTHRDALFTHLVNQLEPMAPKLEELIAVLLDINKTMQASAAGIDAAADRHTATMTALNTRAMKGIGEFATRHTQQAVVKNIAEHEAELRAHVREAFETNMLPALRAFNQSVVQAAHQNKLSAWSTWLPACVTAVLASTITAACVAYLLRA